MSESLQEGKWNFVKQADGASQQEQREMQKHGRVVGFVKRR